VSGDNPVIIATRGSALALAQSRDIQARLSLAFPDRRFELKILKTTGDKLQTSSVGQTDASLPKGLFTKELEAALLAKEADLAVHSLKDLPTELPEGLMLAATPPRADVREVLLTRSFALTGSSGDWRPGGGSAEAFTGRKGIVIANLPKGLIVGTSSGRRGAQLLALHPGLKLEPLRGNVGTRLRKLATHPELGATLLAAAGLVRLGLFIAPDGCLKVDPRLTPQQREHVEAPPAGLFASVLDIEQMLPAVGQGAVGVETRSDDAETAQLCRALNHPNTWLAVTAERAFLAAMGGGCQTPMAGHARVIGHQLRMRVGHYEGGVAREIEAAKPFAEAVTLGRTLADQLRAAVTASGSSNPPISA
jgi:hydroxymethylbilane synthase